MKPPQRFRSSRTRRSPTKPLSRKDSNLQPARRLTCSLSLAPHRELRPRRHAQQNVDTFRDRRRVRGEISDEMPCSPPPPPDWKMEWPTTTVDTNALKGKPRET